MGGAVELLADATLVCGQCDELCVRRDGVVDFDGYFVTGHVRTRKRRRNHEAGCAVHDDNSRVFDDHLSAQADGYVRDTISRVIERDLDGHLGGVGQLAVSLERFDTTAIGRDSGEAGPGRLVCGWRVGAARGQRCQCEQAGGDAGDELAVHKYS